MYFLAVLKLTPALAAAASCVKVFEYLRKTRTCFSVHVIAGPLKKQQLATCNSEFEKASSASAPLVVHCVLPLNIAYQA
jgi:hypothetical protein